MRSLLFLILLIAVGFFGLGLYRQQQVVDAAPQYRTLNSVRGTLISTVGASGTVHPLMTVKVGSQVSGRIESLGVDFNSQVKKGQVIARIDPKSFLTRVEQAEAEHAVALANVAVRQAVVLRAEAELANVAGQAVTLRAQRTEADIARRDAERELKRKRALLSRRVVAQNIVDSAIAFRDQAKARLAAGDARLKAHASQAAAYRAKIAIAKAELLTAHAQVRQRQASLRQVNVDLDHTVIRSPVDGVVIDRSVDVGQIVAASLQAPVLFTIAGDLDRMQVEVDVDEADIGRVQSGQTAKFTVDAYPDRDFHGQVTQVRLNPIRTQNVVTYTVLLSTDNREGVLMPGMTATVEVIVRRRENIVKIPNAALRFKPKGKASAKVRSGPDGGAGARARRWIKHLKKELALSPDQMAQLRGFFKDAREKIMGLRIAGAGREAMMAAMTKIREDIRQSIPGILTEKQLEKYRRLIARRTANPVRRAQVWRLDEQGRVYPTVVWIGADDGNFTELVRGKIAADEALVTGRVPVPPKGKGLFGLRF